MNTPAEVTNMVQAGYFDGRSNTRNTVWVTIVQSRFEVHGANGFRLSYPLGEVEISEALGLASRVVHLPDNGHCEIKDSAAFSRLLQHNKLAEGWVSTIQLRWQWAMLALLLTLGLVFAAYRWGLPAASDWAAKHIPVSWTQQMGDETLALLDKALFTPSTLTPVQQDEMRQVFFAMKRIESPSSAATKHKVQLLFRNSEATGPNALALPNGVIIMTDQLYRLGMKDGRQDEVLGVLAHELGHIEERHSLRMLIESSVVGFALAWYLGDVSGVLASIPNTLLEMHFSRDHEREADLYAAHMMKRNGLKPSALASMLIKLEQEHRRLHDEKSNKEPAKTPSKQAKPKAQELAESLGAYLSSHPPTPERIAALRALD